MHKTPIPPCPRLVRGSNRHFLWPDKIPLSNVEETGMLQTPFGPCPTARRTQIEHRVSDGVVHRIEALTISMEGDEVLVHGDRGMTVTSPPDNPGPFWGRVSYLGKVFRGTTSRITVELSNRTIVTIDVIVIKT